MTASECDNDFQQILIIHGNPISLHPIATLESFLLIEQVECQATEQGKILSCMVLANPTGILSLNVTSNVQ